MGRGGALDRTDIDASGAASVAGTTTDRGQNFLAEESDGDLLSRMAEGDIRGAGQRLVERHYRAVYRKLVYWCDGNEDDACELTQRVFEKILRNVQEYRGQAKFSTYLHSVARNQFIDFCRVERSRQYVGLQDEGEDSDDAGNGVVLLDESPSPDSLLSIVQDSNRVRAAVQRLKPIYREVILLRYFEDRSAEEISEMTGQKFETIRTRIRYGLDQLRVLLRAPKP